MQELFGGQYKDLKPGKWTYSDKFKSYIPGIPDPKKIAEDQAKEYTIEALRRFIKENENKPVLGKSTSESVQKTIENTQNQVLTNDSIDEIFPSGSGYIKLRFKKGDNPIYNWEKGKWENAREISN